MVIDLGPNIYPYEVEFMKNIKSYRPVANRDNHLYIGIPSLGMAHDTLFVERAHTIMGTFPQEVTKSLKGLSSSFYKGLRNKALKPMRNTGTRLPEKDVDYAVSEELYCYSGNRIALLEFHAKAAFEGQKNLDHLPILEYKLLARWRPEFAEVHKGDLFCFRNTGLLDIGSQKVLNAVFSKSEHVDNPNQAGYFSCSMTPLQTPLHYVAIDNVNHESPWLSYEKFYPYWLVDTLPSLFEDVLAFQDMSESEKINVAGAVFAMSSAFEARSLFMNFLGLQPEMAHYFEGLTGVSSDGEPWDGRSWELVLPHSNPYMRDEFTAFLSFEKMGRCVLDKQYDEVRRLCHTVLDDINTAEKRNRKVKTATVLDKLSDCREYLQYVAENAAEKGLDLDFSHYFDLISAFSEAAENTNNQQVPLNVLDDHIKEIEADVISLHQEVVATERDATSIFEQLSEIQASGLPILKQAEMTEKLTPHLVQLVDYIEGRKAHWKGYVVPDLASRMAPHEELPQRDASSSGQVDGKHRLEEQLAHAQAALDEKSLKVESLTNEIRDVRASLGEDISQAYLENQALKDQNEQLQVALTASSQESTNALSVESLRDPIERLISNPDGQAILKLLETLYPDRVRVFDSAYETAANCPGLPASQLYQRAKILITDGIDILRESGRMIDVRNVVPGDLAVHESETVRKSNKLRAHRVFRDESCTREIFTHLYLDYSHRLYFDYDGDEDKILIAYAGRHLPSAKSATV